MFKKLFIGFMLFPALCFSAVSVKIQPAVDIAVGTVSVSTNTATALYAGSDNLAGRTIIKLINTSDTYDVFIGESDVTTASGFTLTHSSDAATSTIELQAGSSLTLYAIGESNGVTGTIDVRVMEIVQK